MVHSTMPLTGTDTFGATTFRTVTGAGDGLGAGPGEGPGAGATLQSGVQIMADVCALGSGLRVTLESRKQCGFHPACFGGSNSPAQQARLPSQASAQACADPKLFSSTTDLLSIAVAGRTVQFRAAAPHTCRTETMTQAFIFSRAWNTTILSCGTTVCFEFCFLTKLGSSGRNPYKYKILRSFARSELH